MHHHGADVRHFPTVAPERPLVDSNGAEDAFSTAFLYAWFCGKDLEECVLRGAVSGAFPCASPGTHEQLITGEQLDAAVDRARRSGAATR